MRYYGTAIFLTEVCSYDAEKSYITYEYCYNYGDACGSYKSDICDTLDAGEAADGLFFTALCLIGIGWLLAAMELCVNSNKNFLRIAFFGCACVSGIFMIAGTANECSHLNKLINDIGSLDGIDIYTSTGESCAISAILSTGIAVFFYVLFLRFKAKAIAEGTLGQSLIGSQVAGAPGVAYQAAPAAGVYQPPVAAGGVIYQPVAPAGGVVYSQQPAPAGGVVYTQQAAPGAAVVYTQPAPGVVYTQA